MQSEPSFRPSTDLVVYTTIMGGSYTLPNVSETSEVSYVCFTDQQYFEANGWQVVGIEPILSHDLPRSSREPKICPHRFLHHVDKSIYVDPSVELLDDPKRIWDSVMKEDAVFGAFHHSFRNSLTDEFIAVFEQGLDSPDTIAEQFNTYSLMGIRELNLRPVWGGFLFRRHNDPTCRMVMERWFTHVLRFSRRDQLSLPIILQTFIESQKIIQDVDCYSSDFHRWPREGYQRPSNYVQSGVPRLFPASFEMRRSEILRLDLDSENQRLRSVIDVLNNEHREKDLKINQLSSDLAISLQSQHELSQLLNENNDKIRRKNERIEKLRQQLDTISTSRTFRFSQRLSKTFRISRPQPVDADKPNRLEKVDLTKKEVEISPVSTSTDFIFDSESGLYMVMDSTAEMHVYVADEKRLQLYSQGVETRLARLLSDYRIPVDLLRPDDLVVDVGANNGEFGIWAEKNMCHYFGFEPDPTAFKALSLNVHSQMIFDIAISDSDGEVKFYLATSDADSSLFRPLNFTEEIIVNTKTLDQCLHNLTLNRSIRLLKIEAEGMEPEVIKGASKTLEIVDYVAVDAGPERGGENTVAMVLNGLRHRHFEVVDCFLDRGTFLLRRVGLHS
jgi:FkbM family methyltransferase